MAAPMNAETLVNSSQLPLYHKQNSVRENHHKHHHHHQQHKHHHVDITDIQLQNKDINPLLRHGSTRVLPTCLWQILLASGILIYGSHAILLHLCKVDGKIPFNSSSVVLLIELNKLLFSLSMLAPEVYSKSLKLPTFMQCVPFAIPALLYCINNNIVVHIQLYIDPASFQVLSNLKIASTALLYRSIIRRRLTRLQWLSMWLLMFAGISNSYGGLRLTGKLESPREIYITVYGLLLIVIYCTLSGLAGVYTEYILKKNYQSSLHLQNSLLYTFGVVISLVTYSVSSWNSPYTFTHGYTKHTVIIIITQAMLGLIMSAVMKHTSNIIRLFIITCAMLVTTSLSMVLWNLQINFYFGLAFVLVFIALLLYHKRYNMYIVRHF